VWILVTMVAVVFQTARTSMQQKLRSKMSITAAGFVRYFYGAPLALAAVAISIAAFGQRWPHTTRTFWLTVTAAGAAQIVGTVALITAFDRRGYAVGTVYSKTEVLQVAAFSVIVLHEPLAWGGWLGAAVCMVGVGWLALARRHDGVERVALATIDAAVGFGLLAGAGFALATVWIRASSKSLGDHPAVFRALFTLGAMNTIQMVVNGAWMQIRKPDDIRAVLRTWRSSAVVGVLSVCGSAGWALAVTLQNAAKVRALGQVELLLTFAVSHRLLGERHRRSEYLASVVVVIGVVGVLALG
jgi:drug/metabolite transporter (DMT)-like permease